MSKENTLTFNPILEGRQVLKTGLYPVCLVVYYNGAKKRYRTKIQLSKEQWEKIKSPKLRDEYCINKRDEIQTYIDKAKKAEAKLKEAGIDFSFDEFETVFFSKKSEKEGHVSFEQCTKEYIRKNRKLSLKTKIMYETVINSVERLKPNIRIKDINTELLEKYEDHLKNNGNSISTVGVYLRHTRAIMNFAIDQKYLPVDKYPFKGYEVPAAERNHRALNDSEIKALIYYKTKNEAEQRAVAFWTFSYLGNGINFTDIARLRYSNINGEIMSFVRTKTSNKKRKETKEIKIYLLPEMKAIIKQYGCDRSTDNDYIYPVLNNAMSARQQYDTIQQFIKTTNKYLKRISTALNFDFSVTTYYARHTYATKQRNSGVSIPFISESLGHSSITTTENYLSRLPDNAIKENAGKLLDL